MNENPNCKLCMLHETAKATSICLKGRGVGIGTEPQLALKVAGKYPLCIFMDSPNSVENTRCRGMVGDGAEWVVWALKRMSITEGYWLDYTVKCYTGKSKAFGKKVEKAECIEQCSVYRIATLQLLKPKAIIVMGALSSLAFVGQAKVGLAEGTTWTPDEPFVRDVVPHVWVSYSAAYPLQDPAESVGVFRTLMHAAEEAGLNPKINKEVTPFDYGF